jgi:FliI/YscN family ATPase
MSNYIGTIPPHGTVINIEPNKVTANFPGLTIGATCKLIKNDKTALLGEVVALSEQYATLIPFGSLDGVSLNSPVFFHDANFTIKIPDNPQGLVLSPSGDILNKTNKIKNSSHLNNPRIGLSLNSVNTITVNPILSATPNPLTRLPINTQLITGISSIDTLTPIGYGQRLGIFAGPGVGKSTLLGEICANAEVDYIVYCTVGERGREVRSILEETIGEESLTRTVMVVSTSDEPPMARRLAPFVATAIAEHYRDQGKRVLLLVDSLTRTARAIREIGLSAGERELRGGLTPSVLRELPMLLERAGTNCNGSITALYTLLTETDADQDPLAQEVKSLLDGHIILSSTIAARGIYPAIDFLQSVSRLTQKLLDSDSKKIRSIILRSILRLERDRELILFGGTPDPELARIMEAESLLNEFLSATGYSSENQSRLLNSLLSKIT